MDLETILPAIGLLGIFAIVFAESGLLFGFFLPGDSLLFTAGFLSSQGVFDIYTLTLVCFIGAVAGDSVGYSLGHKFGKRLFKKKESLFFHPDHLIKARNFYEKHGKKTIILARFMPIVRTFAPIVAGIGDMHYRTFLFYNILGGFLWAVLLPLSGYFLGNLIPDVDRYLLPIVGAIIVVSILPQTIHVLREKNNRQHLIAFAARVFKK